MLLQIPPLVLVLLPGDNYQEMTSGLLGLGTGMGCPSRAEDSRH